MKIVSIVGRKNTGKTSLTVKIIEELKKRGYTVASIKHSHHSMEMDKENTDTWKHKKAGADIVVGVGSSIFFNITQEMDLNRILFLIKHLGNIDYVIIEGFKSYNYPKIITSSDVGDEYTLCEVDSFKITDDEIRDLADLIEKRSHDIKDTLYANSCGYSDGEEIAAKIRQGKLKTEDLDNTYSYLSIDGKVVGLNRFVSDYLRKITLGIIDTINVEDYGVSEISNVELIIPKGDNLNTNGGKSEILINNEKLALNRFTNSLITNTITSMIESLKSPDEYREINIEINGDEISLLVDYINVELNPFSKNILKQTLKSMINSLKVDSDIEDIKIKVRK